MRGVRVGTRLSVALGVVLALLVAVGAVGLVGLRSQQRAADTAHEVSTVVRYVQDVRYYDADVTGWQVTYAFDTYRIGVDAALKDDAPNRAGFLADKASLQALLAKAPTGAMTADERALNDQLTAKWQAYFTSEQRTVDLYRSGDRVAAETEMLDNGFGIYGEVLTLTADLTKSVDARDAAAQALAQSEAAKARALIVGALGVAVAVVVALLVVLTRSLTVPLRRLRADVAALAEGDLTAEPVVDGRDELTDVADGLRTAVHATRATVSDLRGGADAVADLSRELTAVAGELATTNAAAARSGQEVRTAAGEVAGNVTTLAAGAAEMGSAIQAIAEGTTAAAEVSRRAVETADATSASMSELTTASEAIATVVKTITAIAEQTNLLALNATIEAARAGEMGKGFAVVAGEVKDLARQTAEATQDITGKVGAIQVGSRAASEAMAQISEVIATIDSHQTTIAAAVEEQTATTAEMARSAAEAAAGTHEITGVVDGVATAGEAGVRSTERVSATVDRLTATVEQLRSSAAAFRL
ncbi:methyl-accepting chemotaxis protein [Quadrisphaera oryzae]|uniref:methyl-accepting chemotaxis protein n=1 Tax=Quadrisphaera sp. RL12-1S TaxID=2763011 RepID=UPI00351CA3F7